MNDPANKQQTTFKKLRLILIVLLGVIASACLGILSGKPPKEIDQKLSQISIQNWIIAFALVIAAIVLTTYWQLKANDKENKNAIANNLTNEQRKQFIQLLYKRYTARLAQKTGERFTLQMELRYVKDGISRSEQLDIAAQELCKPKGELEDLLRRHKYLLLMGRPGAGKSTLLLGTANILLQAATTNEQAPIPIIFNLASWTSQQPNLAEWMKNILIQGYHYPAPLAEKVIGDGSLLPLLDGLDEVGNIIADETLRNKEREACLAAIQQYQLQRNAPKGMIICTRIDEYKAAGGNAPVYAQLLLLPIDKKELLNSMHAITQRIEDLIENNSTYQASNRAVAFNFLNITKKNPTAIDVFCTPFYFNAAFQVLNRREDGQLFLNQDIDAMRDNLLDIYINRKLQNCPTKQYAPTKVKNWLSWLAHWQNQRNDSSFELADFQPTLLNNKWLYKIGMSLLGILSGVLLGVLFGWFIGLLGIVLLGGLLFALSYAEIETYDIKKWNWHQLLKLRIIVWPLLIGLFMGLFFSLFFGFSKGFLIGFLGGFFVNLIDGSRWGLINIISFTELSGPYQRLWAGFLRISVLYTLLSLLLLMFLTYNFEVKVTQKILFVMLTGGIFGVLLTTNNTGIYQHLILNYCLLRENKLPFPMVPFFDYCADLGLLEKDSGGSWRFRHQLIQDYFLAEYRAKHLETEPVV